MSQYTIIANVKNSVLFIESHIILDNQLLAVLFSGDPKATEIKCLQIISQEFKDRLQHIKNIGNRFYKFIEYFNQIPDNHHFLFLQGHIDDSLEIYHYTRYLSQLDKVPLKSTNLDIIDSYLYDHYKVMHFHGEGWMPIGVKERSKRVCRFCGKTMPQTTFKQKAHAISEAFGNKGLICLEECDECNRRFNETIEQDFIKISQLNRLLYGVKGKHGIPTFKGDSVTIINKSTKDCGAMVLKVESLPDTHDPQAIAQYLSEISSSNIEYIPQNIYKCLCKYVLSLIDSQYLPYFRGTIDWINEPLTKHKLPPVWCYQVNMEITPSVIIMQRKHNNKDIPYCWAIVSVAGWQFLFIVPLCSHDKYKFVGKNRVDFFINGVKNMMPHVSFQPMNLNGIAPVNFKIKAKFEISPDCVEGRDYFFIDRNKDPDKWPVDI